MPRISLAAILPPLLIAVLLVLGFHLRTAGPPEPPPPPTTAAAREATGQPHRPPVQPAANNVQVAPGG